MFNYGSICYCLGEVLEFSLSSKEIMNISVCYIFHYFHNRAIMHTVFGCGAPYIHLWNLLIF